MTVALADWPHVFQDGDASHPVLLMLHGTGGNEAEIAGLAPALDPDAAVLAPRGRVDENGMTRFFRRLAEGVFDVDDVVARAAELAGFVSDARAAYGLGTRPMIAVGLSNGANIALAAALLHPVEVPRVVSLSGMFPLDDRVLDADLSASEVLLLNGRDDPMAPQPRVDRAEDVLRSRGADVTRVTRDGGHGIARSDIEAAQEWLAARRS